jgi:predicted dehydrogenase
MKTPEHSDSPVERVRSTLSRRTFLATASLGAVAAGVSAATPPKDKPIQGFEAAPEDPKANQGWQAVSDRRIRVGIVGYGVCRFGAVFGFQNHPNVEVTAVSDLVPERCAELARVTRCAKTYPSLEKLIEDDRIEAVFVATDAPSHARHCLAALQRGKHVACAVPAVFGSLEDAEALLAAVRTSGRKYMMFETSCFHEDLAAMRSIYRAGGFGELVYTEGEYYHYMETPIDSYKGWRVGLPPQWYPTHSNAYHLGVTGGRFTEVSCLGMPSRVPHLQPANNPYRNPFGTEIALFRAAEGGMSRMAVSWDTPGASGEMGRVRGQRGTYYGRYEGQMKLLPSQRRPPLPPGVSAGGHGGSHGYLMNEFVLSILQDRRPLVDVSLALHLTVAGIVAHQSALKGGEWMKIPEYRL